jgi:peptidoglycan/xylan/chitin deacetylase (PgdA/CDA1 family)
MDKSKVHVALTFDFDAMSGWIAMGATSPSLVSRGEFGAIGVRRVLELLGALGLPATFFVPGHTAAAFPRIVAAILEAGHEIGHHGWVHENPAKLAPDRERWALERGLAAIEEHGGVRPRGYRSPAWDNSPDTIPLLVEYGFRYESSLMAGDFEPYWCRVGDRWTVTGPYEFGRPVDLVELPVAWHLDDVPHFEYIAAPHLLSTGLHQPDAVEQVWTGEFDYLTQRVGSGVLTLTMHPEVIGRGHRMLMLERVLEYFLEHPQVQFTSCGPYVEAWRDGRSPSLPGYVS